MKTLSVCICLLFIYTIPGCKNGNSEESPGSKDPTRCNHVEFGEASELVARDKIDDDRMVIVTGLADPRALVWRDDKDGNTYYITRVMGTEQKLLYFKQIKGGKKPGIASEFRGHLIRWDKLPKSRFNSVAGALKAQYGIQIKPESTYLINAESKPGGCP